jgi:hypothetical protein
MLDVTDNDTEYLHAFYLKDKKENTNAQFKASDLANMIATGGKIIANDADNGVNDENATYDNRCYR